MPGAEMMGGSAEVAPEAIAFTGDPFERSRSNPFQSGGGVRIESIESLRTAATTYGPDWAAMPLASRLELPPVAARPAPEPLPAPEPSEKQFMRISSILWTAGRPLAIFETKAGRSGSVRPGDIIDDWRVEQIGQDSVAVRNVKTGEVRRVLLKTK